MINIVEIKCVKRLQRRAFKFMLAKRAHNPLSFQLQVCSGDYLFASNISDKEICPHKENGVTPFLRINVLNLCLNVKHITTHKNFSNLQLKTHLNMIKDTTQTY